MQSEGIHDVEDEAAGSDEREPPFPGMFCKHYHAICMYFRGTHEKHISMISCALQMNHKTKKCGWNSGVFTPGTPTPERKINLKALTRSCRSTTSSVSKAGCRRVEPVRHLAPTKPQGEYTQMTRVIQVTRTKTKIRHAKAGQAAQFEAGGGAERRLGGGGVFELQIRRFLSGDNVFLRG